MKEGDNLFNVVILAGSSKKDDLEEQESVNNKSFIIINDQPMLAIILKTLKKVKSIEKIVVVGSAEELSGLQKKGFSFNIVNQEDSFLNNIAAGMQKVEPNTPCLVISADIPLLTKEAVEDFILRCSPHDCDLYYPIIQRDDCVKRFPEVERTYIHLKDGTFTGGNIMMVKPGWIISKIDDLNMYLSYRKRPWKLVQTLPLFLIFKYLIRRLTLKEVEDYLSRLFDIKARTVITPYVEIGVDVDKPSDLALVKKVLSSKDKT